MDCKKDCINYKKKKLGNWQKIWEVCPDFDTRTGVTPFWVCLFVPILAPFIYLITYYSDRKRVNHRR